MSQIYQVSLYDQEHGDYSLWFLHCDGPEQAAEAFVTDQFSQKDGEYVVLVSQKWLDGRALARSWIVKVRVQTRPVVYATNSQEVT